MVRVRIHNIIPVNMTTPLIQGFADILTRTLHLFYSLDILCGVSTIDIFRKIQWKGTATSVWQNYKISYS